MTGRFYFKRIHAANGMEGENFGVIGEENHREILKIEEKTGVGN